MNEEPPKASPMMVLWIIWLGMLSGMGVVSFLFWESGGGEGMPGLLGATESNSSDELNRRA